MGVIDLTVTGNDGASDLEARLKMKENAEDITNLFMDEVKGCSRWDLPGFVNASIVLARGSIDFSGKEYEKLLTYFIPRLKNLLQETIQNLKSINSDLAPAFKQLQLDLINKYRDFAFKEIA